jgi:hypothetical protein
VPRNIEVNDDEVGTVAPTELDPGRARVLLQLARLETSTGRSFRATSTGIDGRRSAGHRGGEVR